MSRYRVPVFPYCCNVATRYLSNSLLETLFFSGRIIAFFGIIASLEKGV